MNYSDEITPKISIIVPVYNGEKYIKRCLESILNQTYRNYEVLVIDDGSKDESLKELYKYKKLDTRIKIFSQENLGPSSARNRGIDESSGECLIFVDIDDYIREDYLEKSIKNYEKKSMIFSNVLEIFSEKIEKREIFFCKSSKMEKIEIIRAIIHGKAGLICGKLIDLNLIKDFKIKFNESIRMCEDQLFFLEVALKSSEFIYENNFLYYYDRKNENSLSLKYKKNLYKEQLVIFNKMKELIKNEDDKLYEEMKRDLEFKFRLIEEMVILNEFKNFKFKNYQNNIKNLIEIRDKKLIVKLFLKFKLLFPLKQQIKKVIYK